MGLHNYTEITKPTAPAAVALESWAQGYMVGSLVIMAGKSSALDFWGRKLICLSSDYCSQHAAWSSAS